MRWLKVFLVTLGVLAAWELGIERGYLLYLAVASQNLLKILASRCSLHLEPSFRDILVFYPGFATARSIPIADLVAPTPFVFAVLALGRQSFSTHIAGLCLLAAAHLLTVQAAVWAYTATVFEPHDHSIVVAEAMHLVYLLLYQPLRFAQVPLALFYVHSSRKEISQ